LKDIAQPAPHALRALDIGRWLRALLSSRDSGSSLIEFALCLPPLLILTTGIFAFGITIGNYVSLTNATGIGAMQLAMSRGQTLDPCSTFVTAVYAAAPNLKQSNLTFSMTLNGSPYSGTSCASSSNTTGSAANLAQGATLHVTVTYPCSLRIYNINGFPSCLLTSSTAELIQ
jgi:Flp pilus assembly protein TadG